MNSVLLFFCILFAVSMLVIFIFLWRRLHRAYDHVNRLANELRGTKNNRDDLFREKERALREVKSATQKIKALEPELREKLSKEYKEEAEKKLREKVDVLKSSYSENNIHLIAQALCSPTANELKDKMNQLLEKQFGRLSQELVGQLIDESDQLKIDFQTNLGDQIWNRLQQVKERFKDTPYILPSDCRVAYTKGNRTIVVIEQQPQVRSVTFDAKLVATNNVAKEAQAKTATGYRYRLAFPHVLFFIAFDKGKYAYHELYFRNKPLLSTREYIYLAPIPNVFRDRGNNFKAMCMGNEFSEDINKGDTLARQAEFVISTFWQSTFNHHLGDGGGGKVDKRIKNWAVWQENTAKDPLFVIDVKWTQGRTAKGVIDAMLNQRDHKHELDGVENSIKSDIDRTMSNMSKLVREAVKVAKACKLKKEDVDDFLRKELESLLVNHSDETFRRSVKV